MKFLPGMTLAQMGLRNVRDRLFQIIEVVIMDGVLLQTVEALGDSPFVAGAGAMWRSDYKVKRKRSKEILSDGPLLRRSCRRCAGNATRQSSPRANSVGDAVRPLRNGCAS